MKKGGIIHAALAKALAELRHTDTFVIADSGLPVPRSSQTIDLAVVYGVPSFETVLRAVLAEVVVEGGVVAEQVVTHNPACFALVCELVTDVGRISHESLKARVADAVFVVRTGEAKPYANVILTAGVAF